MTGWWNLYLRELKQGYTEANIESPFIFVNARFAPAYIS